MDKLGIILREFRFIFGEIFESEYRTIALFRALLVYYAMLSRELSDAILAQTRQCLRRKT